MTLIVIFKDDDAMTAFADTRVTGLDDVTLTDFAPKLFSLPIKITLGDPKDGNFLRWECGFAFAGYVMAASFVFAAVSAACTNISPKDPGEEISLRDIAEITKRVYEEVFFDISFRQPTKQFYVLNSAVSIFGHCPIQKKPMCFVIRSGYVRGHPVVDVVEKDGDPICAVLGSGKPALDTLIAKHVAEKRPIHIADAFVSVLRDPSVKTVGGDVQVIRAGKSGVHLPPVVNPTDDPDAPDFKIFGMRSDSLSDSSRFSIGYHGEGAIVYGFDLVDSINRTMLRRLGFDPDSPSIGQRQKNTAGIFGAVAAALRDGSKVKTDATRYALSALRPFDQNRYFGVHCSFCGHFCALIPNSEGKSIDGVFEDDCLFDVLCNCCGGNFLVSPIFLKDHSALLPNGTLNRLRSSTLIASNWGTAY